MIQGPENINQDATLKDNIVEPPLVLYLPKQRDSCPTPAVH